MDTWTQIARDRVHEGYTCIKLAEPELSDAEIMKRVSCEYYPFGEREYWPYKAWLKAIKNYKGIPTQISISGPLFDSGDALDAYTEGFGVEI